MMYKDDKKQYPMYDLDEVLGSKLAIAELPSEAQDIKQDNSRRLERLQKYIKRYMFWRLCLIPVEHRGKLPLVKWREYQSRKANEGEIHEWLTEFWTEDANIGIVCGRVSGNLIVLDFDTDSTWEDFLKGWRKHFK